MKKIWILLLLTLSFLVACAEHNITRSIKGNDTTGNIVSDEEYILEQISGNDYRIVDYVGTKKDLVIPAKIGDKNIVEIGDAQLGALWDDAVYMVGSFSFKGLTRVVIPDSVTKIGAQAFGGNQLSNVILSKNLISIGEMAFAENQLTEVTFPDSLISIGEEAFTENRLTKLVIPDSVINIYYGAFSNNLIEEVTLSNSLVKLEEHVFSDNKLTTVVVPDSINIIDYGTFENNDIKSITLGSSVDIYGSYSFNFDFKTFYDNNGKKEGTYNYNGTNWE